jgi:putative membrane protein insertion efficiency factor
VEQGLSGALLGYGKQILGLLRYPLIGLVQIYRYVISPWLPNSCRFTPTCSAYALEALRLWGPFKGSWLALKRISRCHPRGGHGFDPVPQKGKNEINRRTKIPGKKKGA